MSSSIVIATVPVPGPIWIWASSITTVPVVVWSFTTLRANTPCHAVVFPSIRPTVTSYQPVGRLVIVPLAVLPLTVSATGLLISWMSAPCSFLITTTADGLASTPWLSVQLMLTDSVPVPSKGLSTTVTGVVALRVTVAAAWTVAIFSESELYPSTVIVQLPTASPSLVNSPSV
ncbi:hypothetical protein [Sphaerochaeta sp.]|uniref:hypothetical protein n=1 Tax=Sphaerochaeta sp. TaxID=1972642 RepID=UPI00258814E2|nr:hypothetical protein [Sphaerochaeta sp.]MDD3456857.1 hypothetical protein [Sphaerochaeta sp.]